MNSGNMCESVEMIKHSDYIESETHVKRYDLKCEYAASGCREMFLGPAKYYFASQLV